jgi:hypothetical protein
MSLSGANGKCIFDHDFIIFPGRIQQSVTIPIIPLLQAVLTRFQENHLVEQKAQATPETTPSKSHKRSNSQVQRQKAATKVLSELCKDRTWREKTANSADEKWLESTNRLIKTYNVNIADVGELLLSLGPKVPKPEPPSVKPFLKEFQQLRISEPDNTK